MKKFIITPLIVILFISAAASQQECVQSSGYIIGADLGIERGYTLTPSADGQGYYVGGFKNDSLTLLKVNLNGSIDWSRSFDVSSGVAAHVTRILLDSEGMIALTGNHGGFPNGNSAFVIRYDPDADQILWSRRYTLTPQLSHYSLLQKGAGGNYVISLSTVYSGTDDSNVIEIDKNTGDLVDPFFVEFDLGASDGLSEIIFHEGFIYGTGRYTDGGSPADMRHTIAKLNEDDGTQVWVKLGHRSANQTARLYGADLTIFQDKIYSIYFGDPDGTSLTDNILYVQLTSLEGELLWLRSYTIPGADGDAGVEIISSNGGLVILAKERFATPRLVMFKIDTEGELVWSHAYTFTGIISNFAEIENARSSQLIEVNNNLIFTAYGNNDDGGTNMVVVTTTLDGEIAEGCLESTPIEMTSAPVTNPVFYSVNPSMALVEPQVNELPVTIFHSQALLQCQFTDTVPKIFTLYKNICQNEVFEGYSISGTFIDTFLLDSGCDSIRTLVLTVNVCQPECGSMSGPVYGSPEENERGYCIVVTPENDGLYVAGIKEDSLLLVKIDINGEIQWSRTFDLILDNEEYPYSMIVDSDGMIVLSGTVDASSVGGEIFVLRYDPYNHQVLWQNDYVSSPNSVSGAIIQKGTSGNYVMTNDLNFYSADHIDVELLEIDKNSGAVIPTFAKTYRLTDRESLFKIVYDGNFIYGTGRYKEDEFTDNNFRNTIAKINPDDGSQVWVKMGHIPENTIARLYGAHILVDQNVIISGSYGDPDGTSITNTNLYLQKTSLDGNVIWLKQYLISETNAFNYGIIKSGNGYIILAGQTLPQSEIVMFKIDAEGAVLWAKTFDYSSIIEHAIINPTIGVRGQTKIVEVGNKLFFVGYGENFSGTTDMLIVGTDLDGEIDLPCVTSKDYSIEVVEIDDPVFFSVSPDARMHSPAVTQKSPQSNETLILPREECAISDTIITTIEATICAGHFFEGYNETGIFMDTFLLENGCDSIRILDLTVTPPIIANLNKNICHNESFEGYTISGIYRDTFPLANGCDSIRILNLTSLACAPVIYYDLNACVAYMHNGTNMDYSEFVPSYPEITCAGVSAEILHRASAQENKHSCTPGVNNSIAMCVGSLSSCTYSAGNSASVIIEFSVDPIEDSLFTLSKLEFYEKAPSEYVWIDGPSGPNNYPRWFGVRILKNGVEIFRDESIPTNLSWTLQSFDFIDDELFRTESLTDFRIELLPYCPIGNGATVSAWDLDEIRIYAACAPISGNDIMGQVKTIDDRYINGVQMRMSLASDFHEITTYNTHGAGDYIFGNINAESVFLKGYKNDDVLNGISTLDLIYIQKHLLGLSEFGSLTEYIAADINKSNTVSAVDILELRKLILGINTDFPRNTSWRFGPVLQDFSGTEISAFKEVHQSAMGADSIWVDFIGIKIGDLNGDVVLNADNVPITVRNDEFFDLYFENQLLQKDVPATIDIKAGGAVALSGFQCALKIGHADLVSVNSPGLNLTKEHYSLIDGVLRISWGGLDVIKISKDEILFSVVLIPQKTTSTAVLLTVKNNDLKPELYTDDFEVLQLQVLPVDITSVYHTQWLSVEPNPMQHEAKIHFSLAKDGYATIRFYDSAGRWLHSIEKSYSAGHHSEQIGKHDLGIREGIIYCQAIVDGTVLSARFVILP